MGVLDVKGLVGEVLGLALQRLLPHETDIVVPLNIDKMVSVLLSLPVCLSLLCLCLSLSIKNRHTHRVRETHKQTDKQRPIIFSQLVYSFVHL